MEVVEMLIKATVRGERKLLRLSDKIRERKSSGLGKKQIIDLVSAACSNSTRLIELNAANYQISEQIRIIGEYGKAVQHYQKKEKDSESKIRNLRQKFRLR